MHPRTWPLAAALLGCLCVAAASPQLVLVDSHDAAYLRTGEAVTVNKATLSSLLSALSGLVPAAHIDGSTSDAIANVLKPSPVRKPRAVVVVNVAGISPEDTRSGVFSSDRGQRQVTLDAAADNHASAVVDVIAAMAAANPDVQLVLLDQAGLQNCDAACLQMNLATAAEVFGATFAEGDASSGSTMTFASGAALQLSSPEAKLFSVELASLVAGVKGVAQQAAQAKELGTQEADVALYEVSLVSLAALAEKLGSSAPEVSEAAKDAVITLLKWATQQLDAAYGGDVAYQVMHLDDSVRGATTRSLLSWKDHSRMLLTTQYPPEDEDAAARMFSVKAAGYGAFILLLYFSLAGIWCMCCMPMVKDTLLFGSRKAE